MLKKIIVEPIFIFLSFAIMMTGCLPGFGGDRVPPQPHILISNICEQRIKLIFKYSCKIRPWSEQSTGCFRPVEYVFEVDNGKFQAELRPLDSSLGFILDAEESDKHGIKYPSYIKVEFEGISSLGEIPEDFIMEITYSDGRVETVDRNNLFCMSSDGSKKYKSRRHLPPAEPYHESVSLDDSGYAHSYAICPGNYIPCNLER